MLIKPLYKISYDILPNGTSFIENSIFVRGVQQLGVNPESGVEIETHNLYGYHMNYEFHSGIPIILIFKKFYSISTK